MTGQTLSHYQIQEKLGEGGMGVVYKARDTRLDRFVAIKVLPADKVANANRRQRFVQEAKAASSLSHPNIITVHDICHENGTDFMVMEYVHGKTLGQLIPRKGMRLNEALKISVQIAHALTASHAAGIVHRDLKPGNVMVTENGLVKVLDFGLAKLTETSGNDEEESTRTLRHSTEEGTILGTAAYMSPEQAEGKKVDSRSDVFSFGALLYEMITGQRAFRGDTKLSTLAAILNSEPKPVSDIVPGIPPEVEKLIRKCLRRATRTGSGRRPGRAARRARRSSKNRSACSSARAMRSMTAATITSWSGGWSRRASTRPSILCSISAASTAGCTSTRVASRRIASGCLVNWRTISDDDAADDQPDDRRRRARRPAIRRRPQAADRLARPHAAKPWTVCGTKFEDVHLLQPVDDDPAADPQHRRGADARQSRSAASAPRGPGRVRRRASPRRALGHVQADVVELHDQADRAIDGDGDGDARPRRARPPCIQRSNSPSSASAIAMISADRMKSVRIAPADLPLLELLRVVDRLRAARFVMVMVAGGSSR